MRRRSIVAGLFGFGLIVCTLWAQKPWRDFPAWEYNDFPIPPDYQVPGEWTFARLMYPTSHEADDWQAHDPRSFGDWRMGRTNWTIDYPRSDRHLAMAIRRLTRIDAHSVEMPINLEDDDDVFNYPWLYAVEVGHWNLTDKMVAKFREYLQRGGFFMCDDFHGTDEWNVFLKGIKKVLPERDPVDIPDKDAIFHTVYDLDERYQVPGAQFMSTHSLCEKCPYNGSNPGMGGEVGHFRGIYDDKGRLIAVMTHNNDLGDSWENADDPQYPEKFSALGIRIGVNYIVYSMTH